MLVNAALHFKLSPRELTLMKLA